MLIFFFNDTATTEIYTLSLHDALPISLRRLSETIHIERPFSTVTSSRMRETKVVSSPTLSTGVMYPPGDRKSTRLNSSHANISYAVFCLKKKKPSHERAPTQTKAPPAT